MTKQYSSKPRRVPNRELSPDYEDEDYQGGDSPGYETPHEQEEEREKRWQEEREEMMDAEEEKHRLQTQVPQAPPAMTEFAFFFS
jgi:hypothetical protein